MQVDVLCIGHASYDLVFVVPYHPGPDEKCVANNFVSCGGGPAANAAVAVARLGLESAFVGYLGKDLHGKAHEAELLEEKVNIDFVSRGNSPTPVSAVLVKPDGKRALVNYRGGTQPLHANALDLSSVTANAVLFDGHEPHVSVQWLDFFKQRGSATVLDAGSMHEGTKALMFKVDYLVCSRKFACQYLGEDNPHKALESLAKHSPAVVITLGEEGLIWRRGGETGQLPAFPVKAVDTTGAGDTFHGVFAACIAEGRDWEETLRVSSAAAALCCTRLGARPGIPYQETIEAFLESRS